MLKRFMSLLAVATGSCTFLLVSGAAGQTLKSNNAPIKADGPAVLTRNGEEPGGKDGDDECGVGPCCEAHDATGCDDAACCEPICAADPFCCEVSWDAVCVNAAVDACGCEGGSVCGDGLCDVSENCLACPLDCGDCPVVCPGEGPCDAVHDNPGCDNAECCDAVCAADPFCCAFSWDELCVGGAGGLFACGGTCGNGACDDNEDCQTCPTDCGGCPTGCGQGGDCCTANDVPGCDDTACCEPICAADPFCCEVSWDQICVNQAIDTVDCGCE